MNINTSLLGMFLVLILAGCQSTTKNQSEASISTLPLAAPVSDSSLEPLPLLVAGETDWRDAKGNKVNLKGLNLGNWLAMEMWMLGHEEPMGKGITDQCLMESKLEQRFGYDTKEQLLKLYRDSWMTSDDWNVIANAGFNVVRLPFLYTMLEEPEQPKTLKQDAWHYLDLSIREAKARGLYVILDLHGAPGRQGWEQHTGCAGQNELWDSVDNRERTVWIWQELAKRYQGETTVAGYGLLNEPWGTDKETLKEVSLELYHAIREYDQQHIVILPAHNTGGISAYGNPKKDDGLYNVAFEHHAYPGMFGWGDIGYEVNRDWLDCGESGVAGVCLWDSYIQEAQAPLLIGEMQPWTGLGEMGGENTRATLDKYEELGWAATIWSYKNMTLAGGLANGQWGFVTNAGGNQLLTKSQTWSCNDWETTFEDACDVPSRPFAPLTSGDGKIMYLVIKTGAFNGSDVTYDEIELINTVTGENVVKNGSFENGDAHWAQIMIWGDPTNYDFNHQPGVIAGEDTGKALRITSKAGNNTIIYQPVMIESGVEYVLRGKSKDNGATANDMWSEVYLVADRPQQWKEVDGRVMPQVDINTSTLNEIKLFLSAFKTMEYQVNPWVVEALSRPEPTTLFTMIPTTPSNLQVAVSDKGNALAWSASQGKVDKYKVYRSTSPRSSFKLVGVVTEAEYDDVEAKGHSPYYYYVTAANSVDESYASQVVASGHSVYLIPGRIEAEAYTEAHPEVRTEHSRDTQGGELNIGSFEKQRWVTFDVEVVESGDYQVEYRLASLNGSKGFDVILGGKVIDSVTVPATGDWQHYQTVSRTVQLNKGKQTLKLLSNGSQWNLNWVEFKRK